MRAVLILSYVLFGLHDPQPGAVGGGRVAQKIHAVALAAYDRVTSGDSVESQEILGPSSSKEA